MPPLPTLWLAVLGMASMPLAELIVTMLPQPDLTLSHATAWLAKKLSFQVRLRHRVEVSLKHPEVRSLKNPGVVDQHIKAAMRGAW